jgi:hypothetical protein
MDLFTDWVKLKFNKHYSLLYKLQNFAVKHKKEFRLQN